MGATDQHGPFCRTGGPEVQGAVAGGKGLPGRQVAIGDPSDFPPAGPYDPGAMFFCSFLALVLRKELDRRLEKAGHRFEWTEIKQDLKALQRVTIEENGRQFSIRSQSQGVCGKNLPVSWSGDAGYDTGRVSYGQNIKR